MASSSSSDVTGAEVASSIQQLQNQGRQQQLLLQQQQQQHQDPQQQPFNVGSSVPTLASDTSMAAGIDAEGIAVDEPTPPENMPRRDSRTQKNVILTNEQRKLICLHREANPDMTLEHLSDWSFHRFNLQRKPAMGTLSRILHKKERYNSMTALELQGQRKRPVLCTELDEALLGWISECRERDIYVSYKMICAKARELAEFIKTMPGKESIGLPSFSNGWVSAFTKRHHLSSATLHPPNSRNNGNSENPLEDLRTMDIAPFSDNADLIAKSMEARALRENEALLESQTRAAEAMALNVAQLKAIQDAEQAWEATAELNDAQGAMMAQLNGAQTQEVSDLAGPRSLKRRAQVNNATADGKETTRTGARRTRGKKVRQDDDTPHFEEQHEFDAETKVDAEVPPVFHAHVEGGESSSAQGSASTSTTAITTTSTLATVDVPVLSTRAIETMALAAASMAEPEDDPAPSSNEFLAALRTVINGLDGANPKDVALFKPLFDLERRRTSLGM